MSPEEIKTEVKDLDEQISTAIQEFVLNPVIKKLIERKSYLQDICEHEYVDGKCIYCGRQQ